MIFEVPTKSVASIKAPAKSSIAIGPFGSRMKSDCYVKNGIAVIRGTNISSGRQFANDFVYITKNKADKLKSSNVFKYDLVFPHRGAIGEVGIVLDENRYVISSSLMKLTCNEEIANPLYVYYFFKSKQGRHELLKNASQVGTPGIGQPLASLRSIELPLPKIETQKAIAHILSTLDDKIELNRRMNRTLEEMAQAIFKSWFVDFDPVRAKAEAKAAGHGKEAIERAAMAVIAGKSIDTLDSLSAETLQTLAHKASLFPDSFQPSELGEIPAGWDVSKLIDNAKIIMGQSPKSKFFNTECIGLPFHQGVTNYGERFPTHKLYSTDGNRIAQENDILCSVRAPVGRINIADQKLVIGRGLSAIRQIDNRQSYLVYFLKYSFKEEDRIGSGTIFNSVRKKDMESIPYVTATNDVVEAFDTHAQSLDSQIAANAAQSRTLTELRDTLLPKLLSGELSVADAQTQTDEVEI